LRDTSGIKPPDLDFSFRMNNLPNLGLGTSKMPFWPFFNPLYKIEWLISLGECTQKRNKREGSAYFFVCVFRPG
jgi:hypothetical protein